MLKFSKDVLLILGLAVLAASIYFLIRLFWRMNTIIGMANANRSQPVQAPKLDLWVTSGCSLLAGLLIGAGLALPSRSAKALRAEALAAKTGE